MARGEVVETVTTYPEVRAKLIAAAAYRLEITRRGHARVAARRCERELADLRERRRPVVVQRAEQMGWNLSNGVDPNSGPWCLEPDDSVTPLRVLRDPADPLQIVDYSRPDGSLVLDRKETRR